VRAERTLARFCAPDEPGAEERAWDVVRSAYAQRTPVGRRRSHRRTAGGLIAALVVGGAVALSPAAATVGHLIGRALGVEHAAPALSSLPAPGRLLVSDSGGTWTVGPDGSTRRIGPWREASWSPHGRYLTIVGNDELAAVSPHGIRQWALRRRHVRDPRWYSPTGYRVAYLSGDDLRVVAGDGTGDHLLATSVARVAPAWRPGHPYQLAYLTASRRLVVRDGDSGVTLWSADPKFSVHQLAWSSDGERLLALSPQGVSVYSADGRLLSAETALGQGPIADGALSPDGRTLALVTGRPGSAVVIYSVIGQHPVARRVLAGKGLAQVAWSPDGRWLLISWPAANQWVFVRVVGPPQVAAVSRIVQQFSGGRERFPRLDGWCCNAAGAAG
jgi:WD40 repeat protein